MNLVSHVEKNKICSEFLQLAKRDAVEYVLNPNVTAIVVTGSVARGTADRHSDIDTLIFVEKPCPQEVFDAECKRAQDSGGRVYGGSPEEGFALYRFVNGVRCDIVFDLVSTMETRLSQVLDDYCTDERKQLMIRSVRESVLLYGQELIDSWRRRSDTYPDGLAHAMVRKHLNATPRWVLEKMGADRGERLFLYDCFMHNIRRLLAVLFGLNRTFHPAKLKGIKQIVDALPLAPAGFWARTETLFEKPLTTAVADFADLVEEVYVLVEQNMEEIDTSRAREIFAMKLAAE